jgi:hypothetical protein
MWNELVKSTAQQIRSVKGVRMAFNKSAKGKFPRLVVVLGRDAMASLRVKRGDHLRFYIGEGPHKGSAAIVPCGPDSGGYKLGGKNKKIETCSFSISVARCVTELRAIRPQEARWHSEDIQSAQGTARGIVVMLPGEIQRAGLKGFIPS